MKTPSAVQTIQRIQDFRRAYCRKYRVLPERFAQAVFWQCIPSQVVPFAQMLHALNPRCFAEDFELIRAVAKASSPEDINNELQSHRYQNPNRGLLRGAFKVRLSHQRLMTLAADLLSGTPTQKCERN